MELKRPEKTEYAPYYETYIGKITGNDIIQTLKDRKVNFIEFASSIPEEKWMHKYCLLYTSPSPRD